MSGTPEAPESAGLAELAAAVERDPGDAQTRRRLGVALRSLGRTAEAIAELEEAVRLAPSDSSIRFSLGLAYSEVGRLEEASEAYLRVVAAEPRNAKALTNLGNVTLRRGDTQAAIEWYRRAVAANPAYIPAQVKLGELLRYHGRDDEAYPLFDEIARRIGADPQGRKALSDSLYNMGAINLARNKPELAEAQLAQAVLANPGHRSAHYAHAQALTRLGREAEAQQELERHLQVLHASGEGF